MSAATRRPPREVAAEVLRIEAAAVEGLLAQLDASFDRAIELLLAAPGKVICSGMGKSGQIMRKVAATLSSTGTPALFLHPAEAVHGDLGVIAAGDVVLAASASGTTEELVRMVGAIKRLGARLITITGNPRSPLALDADVHLAAAIDKEACPLDLAPTASTTATLAMGDALAMALLDAKSFTRDDFARLHPAGRLGKRLLKVAELMHQGDALPMVHADTGMRDAIYEMSKKGLGITAVVDGVRVEAGRLGAEGDGDRPPCGGGRRRGGCCLRRGDAGPSDGHSGHQQANDGTMLLQGTPQVTCGTAGAGWRFGILYTLDKGGSMAVGARVGDTPAGGAAPGSPIGLRYLPLRAPVADEIRRRIIDGALQPGERLLEDQLAADLGVSRNPVREALQVLGREGFVTLEPRRGARVSQYSDERAQHVFEVRTALEVLVAGLAAQRRTPEQLAALEAVLAAGRRALQEDRLAELPALNARFHGLLVDAASNPLLAEMVDGLIHQIRWLYTRRIRERGEWSWGEHEQIVAAVAANDVELASRLAGDHVRQARAGFFASPAG